MAVGVEAAESATRGATNLLKAPRAGLAGGVFFGCARQGALTWRCKSSADPTGGTASRTARAAIARWGLKEAAGKALARRTGIAYEAVVLGEGS